MQRAPPVPRRNYVVPPSQYFVLVLNIPKSHLPSDEEQFRNPSLSIAPSSIAHMCNWTFSSLPIPVQLKAISLK